MSSIGLFVIIYQKGCFSPPPESNPSASNTYYVREIRTSQVSQMARIDDTILWFFKNI